MRAHRIVPFFAASLIAGGVTFAQVGRGWSDWPTPYADAQRTSWLQTDPNISVESISKPGFELQWTSKLDNQRRGLHGLTQGVTASGVTLFVPASLVAGSSNKLYMLDNDTGYVIWSRTFEGALPGADGRLQRRRDGGANAHCEWGGPADTGRGRAAAARARESAGLSQLARRARPGHSRRTSRRRATSRRGACSCPPGRSARPRCAGPRPGPGDSGRTECRAAEASAE